MKDYKKRAKGGWNSGKSYKKQSNRNERQYAKREIREELQQVNLGDKYRTKHMPKKPKTKLEKFQHQLNQCLKYLRIFSENVARSITLTNFVTKLESQKSKLEQKIKDINDRNNS